MRVGGPSKSGSIGTAGKARRSGGGGFSIDVASESVPARAAAGASASEAVTGVEALLALQGVDDPLVGRRRAIQRGHDLLDSLEGLRADLLAGRVSGERLQRILSLVRRQSGSGDPKLDEVIADIELRAQVELAKLGRFPS